MRRSSAVAAAALLVLAMIAAALWHWRGRSPSGPGSPAVSGAGGVTVALRVDGGFDTAIERGEPLSFEVFIQGRTDTSSGTFGSAAVPWPRLVNLRAEPDVALAPVALLGVPRLTGVILNGGRPSLMADEDASIARIVGRQRTYAAALGLASGLTSTLPLGRMTITATLGDHTSPPVSIVVTEPSADRELDRLSRSARFSVRAGDYEAGRRGAESVLARDPDHVGAHTTAGDALKGLGRPREARSAYLRALAGIRSGRSFYEEPEQLFARIREVERELGTSAARTK